MYPSLKHTYIYICCSTPILYPPFCLAQINSQSVIKETIKALRYKYLEGWVGEVDTKLNKTSLISRSLEGENSRHNVIII